MRVPDLEDEIEEEQHIAHFVCKNCGLTWSKHVMEKRWITALMCPPIAGKRKSYYKGKME